MWVRCQLYLQSRLRQGSHYSLPSISIEFILNVKRDDGISVISRLTCSQKNSKSLNSSAVEHWAVPLASNVNLNFVFFFVNKNKCHNATSAQM